MIVVGCGGAAPEPTTAKAPPEPLTAAPAPEPEPPKEEPVAEAPPAPEEEPPPASDPPFTEGMTVEQAIAAVPQGTQRTNLDAERLGKPLQDFSIYEPCKPTERDKVKIRVAVWKGRAVGVDVTSKNKKLADCVRAQVWKVTWPDKVPSLNTVDFEM